MAQQTINASSLAMAFILDDVIIIPKKYEEIYIHIILDALSIFFIFTAVYRLNVTILLVTIAVVRLILLKSFIRHPLDP